MKLSGPHHVSESSSTRECRRMARNWCVQRRRGYLRLEACEGTLARCRFWCHGSDVIEMLSTAGHYLISASQLQAFHVRHPSSCQRTLFQPLNLSTRQLTYPHDSYIDIRIECELANSLIHSAGHLKDYWLSLTSRHCCNHVATSRSPSRGTRRLGSYSEHLVPWLQDQ